MTAIYLVKCSFKNGLLNLDSSPYLHLCGILVLFDSVLFITFYSLGIDIEKVQKNPVKMHQLVLNSTNFHHKDNEDSN